MTIQTQNQPLKLRQVNDVGDRLWNIVTSTYIAYVDTSNLVESYLYRKHGMVRTFDVVEFEAHSNYSQIQDAVELCLLFDQSDDELEAACEALQKVMVESGLLSEHQKIVYCKFMLNSDKIIRDEKLDQLVSQLVYHKATEG
jgi:hypothetical protein